MKLYSDAFTGTQVLSDGYKFVMDYDDVICKVKARMVAKTEDDVDIGCGNAFGGNGEEEQGGGDPNVPKVIDLVDSFQYQQTSFDQPAFQKYFKAYMKKVLGYLKQNKKDRVDPFMKGARAFFDWAKEHFGQITFYTPSDYDTDNIVLMSYYDGADQTPTFLYVIDGLKEQKV